MKDLTTAYLLIPTHPMQLVIGLCKFQNNPTCINPQSYMWMLK